MPCKLPLSRLKGPGTSRWDLGIGAFRGRKLVIVEMYSAELPIEFLIEISDLMGLEQTLRQRFENVYPALVMVKVVRSSHVPSP
jgi:hypothetical protein